MTTLAQLTHETGDLTQYDVTQTDGGDVAVTAAAALAGTGYGLALTIDDNNIIYAGKLISPASTTGVARYRAYFDPNGIVMDAGSHFGWCYLQRDNGDVLCSMQLGRDAGNTTFRFTGSAVNDAVNSAMSYPVDITDAPHLFEMRLTRATNATSSDGTLEVWIDGVASYGVTGVDNYDRMSNVGAVTAGFINPQGNPSGTLYIDEIVVNDDGGAIGAYVAPGRLFMVLK